MSQWNTVFVEKDSRPRFIVWKDTECFLWSRDYHWVLFTCCISHLSCLVRIYILECKTRSAPPPPWRIQAGRNRRTSPVNFDRLWFHPILYDNTSKYGSDSMRAHLKPWSFQGSFKKAGPGTGRRKGLSASRSGCAMSAQNPPPPTIENPGSAPAHCHDTTNPLRISDLHGAIVRALNLDFSLYKWFKYSASFLRHTLHVKL